MTQFETAPGGGDSLEDAPTVGEAAASDAGQVEAADVPGGTGQRPDEAPMTGDPMVDEVLASLAGLENVPVSDHPQIYSRAHDALRDALAGRAAPPEES